MAFQHPGVSQEKETKHHRILPGFTVSGLTLICGTALIFAGCATSASEKVKRLEPGNYEQVVKHDQRARSYVLHIPPQATLSHPLPVVLNFHGGGGDAFQHQAYTELDRLADEKGFVVVYPNGTGRLPSRFLTWNAGTCCGYATKHQVDDVGFIRRLLQELSLRVIIDTTRVYATGLSNGAMMAYRLAAEAPDLVAAIAPIAGAMALPRVTPTLPVPIMHVHSVDDPRAPYEGGLGQPFPLTRRQEYHYPVEAQLRQWTAHNHCPSTPNKEPVRHGFKGTNTSHHTAQKLSYSPCQTHADVWLWKLSGAGHVWPGGAPTLFQRFLGPPTGIIQINKEMWKFFSRFQR